MVFVVEIVDVAGVVELASVFCVAGVVELAGVVDVADVADVVADVADVADVVCLADDANNVVRRVGLLVLLSASSCVFFSSTDSTGFINPSIIEGLMLALLPGDNFDTPF